LLGDAPSEGKGYYTLIDMDFFEIDYVGFIKHQLFGHIESDATKEHLRRYSTSVEELNLPYDLCLL
jgi:hypothetical protein